MKKNGNDPLQEELRSSQVYKLLTGSGMPVAGKIAQGLSKAAQGLDQAVEGLFSNGKAGTGNHPYQAPPQQNAYRGPYQTGQAPPNQGASQTQNDGYYHYSYQKGAARQKATQPQNRAQKVAAAQRAAAAKNAAQQQAAAARQQARGQKAAPQPAPGQPPMKLVHTGSPAKFYITGGAAVAYALLFPLYEIHHFVIFAVVLALVFLLSGAVFKGKKRFVPVEAEKPQEPPKEEKKPEKEKKSSTGNPEVDKLIEEGREYLKKLRAADEAIPDEDLSQDITRMERASADIFRYIGAHPEKAPQIRKFMNYYLPTTLKLLNSYQRLSAQSVKGENISSTLFNIAGMMHTVADAFEKQLDALYAEEAMDISADITVFEAMLKQEGFVDEDKQQEQAKK